jgi:hypothetical protein
VHKHWLVAAIVLLTGLAGSLRLWHLDAAPPGFHYDEALEALEAWRVLTVPGYHPLFFPGDFGLAPTFIYLSSLVFRFWPATPAASRAIAAIIGTATIPAVYALGRELVLFDDRVPPAMPLFAAAILATLRWHVTFSRVAIEPILAPLYAVLVLWALFRGLRTNRAAAWLGLGLALGLSAYAYPAAWLLPPLVVAIVIFLLLTDRPRLAGRMRGLVLAGLLAGIIIAPLAIMFVADPGLVLMRTNQVAAVGGHRSLLDALSQLGSNLLKSLGMFSVAGDMDPRSNIPGRPALDPLLSIPFYLGLIVAIRRWQRPAMATLLLAGCAMLANTVFSQFAPHFRRALGLTPVIALISGLGLAIMWGWFRADVSGTEAGRHWLAGARATMDKVTRHAGLRHFTTGIVMLLLVGSAVINTITYYRDWAPSPELFYAYDEGLWQIAAYVESLPTGQNILVTPRLANDATLAFAWRAGPNVRNFDGRAALIVPGPDRDTTYVVIDHEDFRGAGLIAQVFPNATVDKVFYDRDGQVYARAFHVPAGSTPMRKPQVSTSLSWSGLNLIGYDVNQTVYHPGDLVYLQLWWQASVVPDTKWTVFTHLLGPAKADGSTLWAGRDGVPGEGSVPTTSWQPGDTILDEYQIQLGTDMPAGDYQIEVGLYNPAGGQRAVTTSPPGLDHFLLGQIRVQ